MAISQKILDGRLIVDEYHEKHSKLYKSGLTDKEIIASHAPLIEEMNRKLKELGFENAKMFLIESKKANLLEGI